MSRFARLPRQVVLLGWVSFFADISSEMVYPLVPLFVVGILGAPGFSLGLIEGVAQAVVSLCSAFSGIFSDRSGKRVLLVRWGYGLPIFGKALLAVAGSWGSVLVGRSIDRFGKGIRGSPRDALIANAVSIDRRGSAFGLHRTMDTAGAVVGVLIAGLMMYCVGSDASELAYRRLFWLAAGFAGISVVVALLLKGDSTTEENVLNRPQSSLPPAMVLPALGRTYWTNLAVLAVFSLANSSDTFLLLRAADLGLNPWQVILAYALCNSSYALGAYPAGVLSDRVGRWNMIAAGWTIYALVYAGMALGSETSVWLLLFGYGFYLALTDGVAKALIADSVGGEYRGTALGMLYAIMGITTLTSNLLAGYAWDAWGKAAPFWIGACTALASVALVLITRRK